MAQEPKDRPSDRPLDFEREREQVIRQFLRRGLELTESMITENQALRAEVERLRAETIELRAQLAKDAAIRELLQRIEELEKEKHVLLERSRELVLNSSVNEQRALELETELHHLANLHIALSHLHASLSPRRTLRTIAELLHQLVGANAFCFYRCDTDFRRVYPFYHVGQLECSPVEVGEGVIGTVLATGMMHLREPIEFKSSQEDPIAVIPLRYGSELIGAIVIFGMLPQKQEWTFIDRQLLELLGNHGGTALLAASLYGTYTSSSTSPVSALHLFNSLGPVLPSSP
ncbi:MAG: GAF domain-containing protein [Sandaracinaceae bacterium]|nr:GAF domain-containing protein [Sandaracinaceae bacterium]